jgi:hypothetical protein
VTKLRKRIHHELTFNERLAEHAREAREQSERIRSGAARDSLLEKARQFEAQISFNNELFGESRAVKTPPLLKAANFEIELGEHHRTMFVADLDT